MKLTHLSRSTWVTVDASLLLLWLPLYSVVYTSNPVLHQLTFSPFYYFSGTCADILFPSYRFKSNANWYEVLSYTLEGKYPVILVVADLYNIFLP